MKRQHRHTSLAAALGYLKLKDVGPTDQRACRKKEPRKQLQSFSGVSIIGGVGVRPTNGRRETTRKGTVSLASVAIQFIFQSAFLQYLSPRFNLLRSGVGGKAGRKRGRDRAPIQGCPEPKDSSIEKICLFLFPPERRSGVR